ncbi:MAG: SIR2 family protein [Desulfurellaceae bacterium]|nr:SIR2 family protein [Desulfurellaceae bacterium]
MILLFVGAGGSAAVDEKQYPVARGFFEKVQGKIKQKKLFETVCQSIEKERLDIEDVLEVLDKLQESFMGVTSGLGEQLYTKGGVTFASERLGHTRHTNEAMRDRIVLLNDDIKARVYNFYGKPPPTKKLSSWIHFLSELEQFDSCLQIFTTNYDLVLEEATKQAGVHVNYGLDNTGRRTRLDVDFWHPPKDHLGTCGLLTKLHGSVDWQRENDEIIVGSSHFTGEHENHCLLYPGHKGSPDTEPFISFHNHLRNVVQRKYGGLTAAVFVGYAFRDDYINAILAELPSHLPVFIIFKFEGDLLDTGLPPTVPLSVTFAHDGSGLTEETMARCLSYLNDQRMIADEL